MQRSKEPVLEVGVVHLMGTIGEAGEYDAGSVRRTTFISERVYAERRSRLFEDYGKRERMMTLDASCYG